MNKKNLYSVLGLNIRRYRIERMMTQEELAERSDKTSNYISRIELGAARFSCETLFDIANALSIPVEYLLDIDEMDDPHPKRDENGDLVKITQLLEDCSEEERKSIVSVVKAVKRAIRTNKK